LAEAALRHSVVALVSVYSGGAGPDLDRRRLAAEQAIHDTMDAVVTDRADLPVVTWHVVQGEAADVLVRESAQSQLLVMGSHGVSSILHSALGSVTDICARMADCPVVVLPPTSRATLPGQELVAGGS
jgi:nucleotide-binding universal stress UspA family protein